MCTNLKTNRLRGIYLLPWLLLLWIYFPTPEPTVTPPAVIAESNGTVRALYVRDVWVPGHSHPHPELCPAQGERLRLLIMVTSAPDHAIERAAVRLTWGQHLTRIARDVALAFVLGAPPPELEQALDDEDKLCGDLIRGRSLDSYYNLTLKTLSLLEWTKTYCPRVRFILKTDDDVFINVPKLLDFVSQPLRIKAVRTIWGWVWHRSAPKRSIKSKYYMSVDKYSKKVYPDYVSGQAYLFTNDSITPLLAAAPNEEYFNLEDVFVTGMLAQKLGIARRHAFEFRNSSRQVIQDPCTIKRLIMFHTAYYRDQFELWNNSLKEINCSGVRRLMRRFSP